MKIRGTKYCVLFLLLTQCGFLNANFDEYSPENVQKLSRLTSIVSGVAIASFFCYHVIKYKHTPYISSIQKHIKNLDIRRSFSKMCCRIAHSHELFSWACIHTIFKA